MVNYAQSQVRYGGRNCERDVTTSGRLCRGIMSALSFIQRPVCTGEQSFRSCVTLGFLPDLTRTDKRQNGLLRIILAPLAKIGHGP